MNNEQLQQFLLKADELRKEFNASEDELRDAFYVSVRKEYEQKTREKMENNKALVSRCFITDANLAMFPSMKKYIKVLSHQSTNEYRVECLTFCEHPTYWFNTKNAKMNNFGNFDFDSFIVEDIPINDIDEAHEIDLEEYNAAANMYLDELLKLRWTTNHDRCGNKLPTDDGWEK